MAWVRCLYALEGTGAMSDPTRERIRVAIAGRIHARPTLVRRFLEDDGFDVVDVSSTMEGTLAAVAEQDRKSVV